MSDNLEQELLNNIQSGGVVPGDGTPPATPLTQAEKDAKDAKDAERKALMELKQKDREANDRERALKQQQQKFDDLAKSPGSIQLGTLQNQPINVTELNIIKRGADRNVPSIDAMIETIVFNSIHQTTDLPGGGKVFYVPTNKYQQIRHKFASLTPYMTTVNNPPRVITHKNLAKGYASFLDPNSLKLPDAGDLNLSSLDPAAAAAAKAAEDAAAAEAAAKAAEPDGGYTEVVVVIIPSGLQGNGKYADGSKGTLIDGGPPKFAALSPQLPLDMTVSPLCLIEKVLARFLYYYLGADSYDLLASILVNAGDHVKFTPSGDLDPATPATFKFDQLVELVRNGLHRIVECDPATVPAADFYPISPALPAAYNSNPLDPAVPLSNGISHYQFHSIETLYQSLKVLIIPMVALITGLKNNAGGGATDGFQTNIHSLISDDRVRKLIGGFHKFSLDGLKGITNQDLSQIVPTAFNTTFEAMVNDPKMKKTGRLGGKNVWEYIVTGHDPSKTMDEYFTELRKDIPTLKAISKSIYKDSLLYDLLIIQYYSSEAFRKTLHANAGSVKTTTDKVDARMFLFDNENSSLKEPYWQSMGDNKQSYYGMLLSVMHEQIKDSNNIDHGLSSDATIKAYQLYNSKVAKNFYEKAIKDITDNNGQSLKEGKKGELTSNIVDDSTPRNAINMKLRCKDKPKDNYTKAYDLKFANPLKFGEYDVNSLLTPLDTRKTPHKYSENRVPTSDIANLKATVYGDAKEGGNQLKFHKDLPTLFHLMKAPYLVFIEETENNYTIHYMTTGSGTYLTKQNELKWSVTLRFDKTRLKNYDATLAAVNPGGGGHDENPLEDVVGIPGSAVKVSSTVLATPPNGTYPPLDFSVMSNPAGKPFVNSMTFLKDMHDRYIMGCLNKLQGLTNLSNHLKNNGFRLYDQARDKPYFDQLFNGMTNATGLHECINEHINRPALGIAPKIATGGAPTDYFAVPPPIPARYHDSVPLTHLANNPGNTGNVVLLRNCLNVLQNLHTKLS